MLTMTFRFDAARPPKVLAIGAHADDIEIGCGGTILRLVEEHPNIEISWVVLSGTNERVVSQHRATYPTSPKGPQSSYHFL